jgi:hypothetical protein
MGLMLIVTFIGEIKEMKKGDIFTMEGRYNGPKGIKQRFWYFVYGLINNYELQKNVIRENGLKTFEITAECDAYDFISQ